jgi:hypothetical protein
MPGTMTKPGGAETVLHAWIDAVNAKDLERLVSFYTKDASLVPTFSAMALRTTLEIRRYFEQLAARPGLSVSLHPRTVVAQEVAGMTILTGVYCFHFLVDDEPYHFEARFSLVTGDPTGPSPILHHHSSQIPRQLA